MRLIDADELEKAIYKWMPKDMESWMDSSIPPIENLVVSIMMTIEEQPTVNQWIPVSEDLPKKKGYYFVTRKNPKGHVTKAKFDPSMVERGVYNSPWGNGDSDVLAWMELPKPYKGGKK